MLALLAACLLHAAPPAEKPRLIVTELTVAGGLDPKLAASVTDAVAQEIASRGVFQVLSAHDVAQLVGLERQKELLGCSEESTSCLGELAGALNARFVVSGTLAKLGDAYQLTLQMLDNEKAKPVGRASRIVQNLDEFKAVLPYATAEATGVRPPEPPAKWPAITAYSLGAVAAIGALATAFQAYATETAIRREFATGRANPAALRSLADYRSDLDGVNAGLTLALGLTITAAVFVVGGTAWLYFTHQLPGGINYHLTPTPNGAALVGSF